MWMTFILCKVVLSIYRILVYSGWLGILYCAGSNFTAKKQRKQIMTNKKNSDLYMRFRKSACKDVTFTCAFIEKAYV